MNLPTEMLIQKLLKEDFITISQFVGYPVYSDDNLKEKLKEAAAQMPEENLLEFFEKYGIDPYDPNERQQKCRFAFPYLGPNHNQTYCRYDRINNPENAKEGESYVTNEDCDKCPYYKSKYIEYPIKVNKINYDEFHFDKRRHETMFVAITPCAKEYENKTFLGLYLGDLPCSPTASYNEKCNELTVKAMHNPAIYVFELGKIIFGMQSWWKPLKSLDEFAAITKEDIESQPYMQALRQMSKPNPPKTNGNTVNLRVTMNIECPAENEEKLRRFLDHHIEYLVDLDNNQDVIKSISNVTCHNISNPADNGQKLQTAAIIIDDILETEASDDEIGDNEELMDLYAEIHNLHEALRNTNL